MKKFQVTTGFKGYRNKEEETTLGPGFIVDGSQNVLSTDRGTIKTRKGYTLLGAADATASPIISSFEWLVPELSTDIAIRTRSTVIEFYYSGAWRTLESGLTEDEEYSFALYWDSTEVKEVLLIADGTSTLKMWSGGIAVIASTTSNTITKTGTATWAESGFLTAGTRQVEINGTTYTYTGGEGTTTLTGVTGDPTGEADASIVSQTLRSHANTPASGFNNDIIEVINNQLVVGDFKRRDVYFSQNSDYTDFTFSSPRAAGEGALITIDSPPIGFTTFDNALYVSGNKNDWYKSKLTLIDSSGIKEDLTIEKLRTGSQQGAKSDALIGNMKNFIVFVSNEPTLDQLGRVEAVDSPDQRPLSDPVKNDFDSLSFTNAHVKYFKNNIYIALPAEDKVLIYNVERGYWEAPQILPIRRLAIIGGALYGHSSSVSETYKLFDGTNDNTNSFKATANLSYLNFGDRVNHKSFDEWFNEGYISANTTLTFKLNFELGGSLQQLEYDIDGSDEDIIFTSASNVSLGEEVLGDISIGGDYYGSVTTTPLDKFKIIHEISREDFHEIQPVFETDSTDYEWEILAFGPNANIATAQPIKIKK